MPGLMNFEATGQVMTFAGFLKVYEEEAVETPEGEPSAASR